MCPARDEMHGDPEAMRRFAERLAEPVTADVVADPPDPTTCHGVLPGCGTFAAADAVSTLALTAFLAETADAVATLRDAATVAAEDYLATDRVGAHAVAGAVLGVVIAEERA